MFMIPNPFRRTARALHNKKGFYNPCSHCWRLRCKNCLVYLLADFAAVLRSNPKMSRDFDKLYNKFHGNAPTTRQERREMDRNVKTRNKKLAKSKEKMNGKKPELKAVK